MNAHPEDHPWRSARREKGVYLLAGPSDFETVYAAVRRKERRLLTDAQVAGLPNGSGLWNAGEWRLRWEGAEALQDQLSRHGRGLRVLEVGCGNGWLSGRLSRKGHDVLGIDVVTDELEQAARVFPATDFARADLFTSALPRDHFDAVIFAASIQYFADLPAVMKVAFTLLAPGGTVHLLDTILYTDALAAEMAGTRTAAYYRRLGYPAMADHYHAHRLDAVKALGRTKVVSAPSWKDWLLRARGHTTSPFTHVELRPRT